MRAAMTFILMLLVAVVVLDIAVPALILVIGVLLERIVQFARRGSFGEERT